MSDRKHQFACYPSATEGNPLLGVPHTEQDGTETLVPLPGIKYDPLMVELYTGKKYHPYVRVYRNGTLIAHSSVDLKDDYDPDEDDE